MERIRNNEKLRMVMRVIGSNTLLVGTIAGAVIGFVFGKIN